MDAPRKLCGRTPRISRMHFERLHQRLKIRARRDSWSGLSVDAASVLREALRLYPGWSTAPGAIEPRPARPRRVRGAA